MYQQPSEKTFIFLEITATQQPYLISKRTVRDKFTKTNKAAAHLTATRKPYCLGLSTPSICFSFASILARTPPLILGILCAALNCVFAC
ncbi:MAG: Unknown protein [uncultured Thiotrichaceae bacterium]|uniref:Uncharacterized protein n=1 Tax=uncultured Thiotrichaceae bacterium TaxID=298394 RepID=A0A6S6U5L1_9GAMM|nr:MAG: Unknown protein [uncultured Thiotrichaceae bacterium]